MNIVPEKPFKQTGAGRHFSTGAVFSRRVESWRMRLYIVGENVPASVGGLGFDAREA
jgi:hypothetical protein